MVKNGCVYLSSAKVNKRSDNTFVQLSNGLYGNIVSFIVDFNRKKEFVLLQVLETIAVFSNRYFKIVRINSEIIAAPTAEIQTVCVCLDVSNEKFICSVPNLFSY